MKVVYLLFHKDSKRPTMVSFTPNGMKRHITKMIRTGSMEYCAGTKAAQIRRLRDDFMSTDPISTVNKRFKNKWRIEAYMEGAVRR